MKRSLSEIETQLYRWAEEMRGPRSTPEERLLANAFSDNTGYWYNEPEGCRRNGWYWQYPKLFKGPRGKQYKEIFDFFHGKAGLIVEVDGPQHKPRGADRYRDDACRFNGWEVLRFPNERIRDDLTAVLAEIEAAVKRKGENYE